MEPLAFAVAVIALLATPGPTNTLLAASGAAIGVRGSLKLVPAEVCGYLGAILVVANLLGPLVSANPMVGVGVKLAACAWLLCCARRLWCQVGHGRDQAASPVTAGQVFLTTAVNPKALIFALVIIPAGAPLAMAPWLAGFSALVMAVGVAWIGFGAAMARSAGPLATPHRISRIAGAGLALFATVLATATIVP